MPITQSAQPSRGAPVNKILEEMYGEFQSLMLQRAAILRRIGTIKQTIIGLAKLFGNEAVGDRLLEVVEHRSSTRSRGIHQNLPGSTDGIDAADGVPGSLRRHPAPESHPFGPS